LRQGYQVVGLDNLNDYYDVGLKRARLERLQHPDFEFAEADVADSARLSSLFSENAFNAVVHLAAQAGVRYSLDNPAAYIQSNVVGTSNLLEQARQGEVKHFVYASSSSVYGMNRKLPFSEGDPVDHPVSLYAATKKSTELIAHSYSHLFGLPTTGLRFFTVYGPWGRPDMAAFLFTKAILAGEPIKVFNHGKMRRDFTYVEDIAAGVIAAMKHPAAPDPDWSAENPSPASSSAPYRVYNIGNHQSVELGHFISVLESAIGRTAEKIFLPLQPGDVLDTYAETEALQGAVGFRPTTSIEVGLPKFVAWYREYYGV
jgi:UDP-glucuronate 4-epimerase